jgi:hypothetical protein
MFYQKFFVDRRQIALGVWGWSNREKMTHSYDGTCLPDHSSP